MHSVKVLRLALAMALATVSAPKLVLKMYCAGRVPAAC